MEIYGEIEDEKVDITIKTDSKAKYDVINERMWMEMSMDMIIPDEGQLSMDTEIYLIDAIMYGLMEVPEHDPVWVKSEVPEKILAQMKRSDSQIELLETAVDVNILGSEKVRGVDCYVLQIIPDAEKLWEITKEQAALGEERHTPICLRNTSKILLVAAL